MSERGPDNPFGPSPESEAEKLKKERPTSLILDKDLDEAKTQKRGVVKMQQEEANKTADAILEGSELSLEDDDKGK